MNDKLARLFLELNRITDKEECDSDYSVNSIKFTPHLQRLHVVYHPSIVSMDDDDLLVQTTTVVSRQLPMGR